MATWTIYKKLNVSPNSYPLVIPIKQYSSDFALKFKLYSTEGDLDIESGATTRIRGTKRDGNGFELNGTRLGRTVTFSGTKEQMQQMTAAHGRCVFEVVVEHDGKELITANFYLEVQRAAMDAGTVTSESIIEEFADFQSKITAAIQAATAAQTQADRAEAAAESIDFGIDPTLSQSGQAADAEVTGKVKNGLNAIIYGGNYDYPITWINGYYINNNNGEAEAYTNWMCTDFIEIDPNAIVKTTTTATNGTGYNAFYSDNKSFLQKFTNANTELVIPENAKYMRLSCRKTEKVTVLLVMQSGMIDFNGCLAEQGDEW